MARLTKRAVDAAKASGTGWTWLADDEVPGFGALIYPSGTKTFALRYRTRPGRQRMLKLGQYGELTVQQARDVARKEKVRVLEGKDPRAERERARVGIGTVRQLVDRWRDDYAKSHRKAWKEDESRLERHVRPHLGSLPLPTLSPERVARWHRKIGKNSPVEANRCLETVRAAWRWADRQELLPAGLRDPTRNVTRFRERSRDRWLRPSEIKSVMKQTRRHKDPHIRAAIPLLLLTGLRKSELLSARWDNIDLERGEIRLPETKSGEAQVRVLTGPALEILQDLPRYEENPFVFPSPTGPQKPRKDIKRQWEAIREDAKLEDITLHDLRRTAGSFMAQAGVPLQVIQQVLGHSHPGVTKLYARLSSKNEREALETLAGQLGDMISNRAGEAEPDRKSDLRSRIEGLLQPDTDSADLPDKLRELMQEIETYEA